MAAKKNGTRFTQFVRWGRGLAPHYRPTIADLEALAAGFADAPPVNVIQVRR